MHINQFNLGAVTPVLSYALSVLGSLLGLICTVRARNSVDSGQRSRWLLLAAWAMGGTGIWVMHFMAMLGFAVDGVSIRYDLPTTIASWLIAMVVVAIGLFIVGSGKPTAGKILLAGPITGVGVAAMHYTGMAAMRMPATIHYDRRLVIASIAIAVVAATVALWFTVTVRSPVMLLVAALIMGVAVNGMHFTGMFAMSVTAQPGQTVSGFEPMYFVAPIALFVMAVIAVLFVALINRNDADDHPDGGGFAGPLPTSLPGTGMPGAAVPGSRLSGAFPPRSTGL
jgi:NO-binding membrane sensor protein with MHYT domain